MKSPIREMALFSGLVVVLCSPWWWLASRNAGSGYTTILLMWMPAIAAILTSQGFEGHSLQPGLARIQDEVGALGLDHRASDLASGAHHNLWRWLCWVR